MPAARFESACTVRPLLMDILPEVLREVRTSSACCRNVTADGRTGGWVGGWTGIIVGASMLAACFKFNGSEAHVMHAWVQLHLWLSVGMQVQYFRNYLQLHVSGSAGRPSLCLSHTMSQVAGAGPCSVGMLPPAYAWASERQRMIVPYATMLTGHILLQAQALNAPPWQASESVNLTCSIGIPNQGLAYTKVCPRRFKSSLNDSPCLPLSLSSPSMPWQHLSASSCLQAW